MQLNVRKWDERYTGTRGGAIPSNSTDIVTATWSVKAELARFKE